MTREERNHLLKQALAHFAAFGKLSSVRLDGADLVVSFAERHTAPPRTFKGHKVRIERGPTYVALSGRRAHS